MPVCCSRKPRYDKRQEFAKYRQEIEGYLLLEPYCPSSQQLQSNPEKQA